MARPKDKTEYRQQLAEDFASLLDEKGLDWHQEWSSKITAPYNAITRAHYRGNNYFNLSLIALRNGYTDPRWVTMVQIMDKNQKYHSGQKWHLRKGSKAAWVEYWFPYDLVEKQAVTWEQYHKLLKSEERQEDEFRISAKYTPVYNASLVDGIPPLPEAEHSGPEIAPDELVNRLSTNMGVPIYNDGGNRAFYRPSEDAIHLPLAQSFENEYAYNATALHELAHSTGHPSRLNREQSGGFGSASYGYEELIAEMTACFMGVSLSATASEQHIKNHKAYVQGWAKNIRADPNLLIHAIKDAQSAAQYMDWKAELITDIEYAKSKGQVIVRPEKEGHKTHPDIGTGTVQRASVIQQLAEIEQQRGYKKAPQMRHQTVPDRTQ